MTKYANDHPYKVVVGSGGEKVYANDHPIKVEVEGGVVTPSEFEELERKVDALATDLSYKGGVPTYEDLPEDPEQGDVYTTEDTGVLYVWDGTQWVPLNDTGSNTIVASTAPTTATEGELGQFYVDTSTGKVYVLTAISGSAYTWTAVGPTVVQTTGTSTTDVMSQNAVTSMVFADPGTNRKIAIGGAYVSALRDHGIAIGRQASADLGIAIGERAACYNGGIAIGERSVAQGGCVSFGHTSGSFGYNNTSYRLLTGVYPGVSDHHAATVGQLPATLTNSQFNSILENA